MEENKPKENWFVELITHFVPERVELRGKTPKQLSHSASWKAFASSAIVGLIPAPVAYAAIVPELIALVKIQVNLIYSIAEYHGQAEKINGTLLMYIFGTQMGVQGGQYLTHVQGSKLVVSALTAQASVELAKKIGIKITEKAVAQAAGRLVPLVVSPLFGYFAKRMTLEVGRRADDLFSEDIIIEKVGD